MCRIRRIIAAEATTLPSSEKPTAPAAAIAFMGARRSPRRPSVAAPTGKTRQRPVSLPRSLTKWTSAGESIAGSVLGMQQTAVKPPATALAVPVAMVSARSPPGSRRCT